MKKFFVFKSYFIKTPFAYLLIAFYLLSVMRPAFAVNISPSPTTKVSPSKDTPTDAAELQRIEQIKNLVASRVAELKLVDRVGFLGTVQESGNTQITIQDINETPISIDIDELTKFSDSANNKFGISDIKKNDTVAAVGLFNKQTKRLLARLVTKMYSIPVYFEGILTDKDTKNFTFTARDEKGKERILNIESSTKILSFANVDDSPVKSGFSKINTGIRIFAAGFGDLKDKKILNVARMIAFLDLSPSVEMEKYAPNVAEPSGSLIPTGKP